MIIKSLKDGLSKVSEHKKLVLIFYLANLVFALLIVLPLRSIIANYAGDSLMAASLAGRLDMNFLIEFLIHQKVALAGVRSLMLVVPVLYWLALLFLSGGVLAAFVSEAPFSRDMFWGSAGLYFGRFLRLFLWSLPVLAILLLLPLLVTAVQRLFFGSDPYESVIYWCNVIKAGLRVIAILIYFMIFDYARIDAILNDRKSRVSLWRGTRVVFGSFGYTFGLALLLTVLGWLALVIYNPLADLLAAPGVFVILLLVLLQQAFMFFRTTLKLATYASQVSLFQCLVRA